MTDKILTFIDSFYLRTGSVKASSTIKKYDIVSGAAKSFSKVTTDGDTLALKGFAQAVSDATGGTANGDTPLQVIMRGGKILLPCAASLQSGQNVILTVSSGAQSCTLATAADFAAGKVIGKFLFYSDSNLDDAGIAGDLGVIQT